MPIKTVFAVLLLVGLAAISLVAGNPKLTLTGSGTFKGTIQMSSAEKAWAGLAKRTKECW